MMNMYRKGTLDDCKSVYDLICEMEGEQLPFAVFSEIYREQMDSERYVCFVCEEGGVIVGVLNLRFERQLHHAALIAEVLELAVASAHRRKGIGKELLARASQLAKEAGCLQIELTCNHIRKDAHRFYLREGMKNSHFKFSKVL